LKRQLAKAEQRNVVANDIRDLDDTAFASYKNKLEVLIKKTIVASEKTTQNNQNNSQTNLETVINNGKKTETVPNTTQAAETLQGRMKKAFNVDTGFLITN
jgi:hypothetical protein